MTGQPEPAWGFGMTDLQDALIGPDGPAARRDALACIDTSLAHLDARVLGGLNPQQMTQTGAVRDALETARAVLTGQ